MAVKILYSKKFLKNFRKRIAPVSNLSIKFNERVAVFAKNPKDQILKDHSLTGDKKDYRAFWITGDFRVMYLPTSKNEVLFLDIGTHNQVY